MKAKTSRTGLEIAVIGMSGVFPGASNIQQFWDNLLAGQSAISLLSDAELIAAGVHPGLAGQKNFVKAKGVFPDIEYFDAKFFDYTPRDAAMMDPQVRALHQCVYHSLEDAGYASEDFNGSIGLFAGASGNFVWELSTLLATKEGSASQFATTQLNDKDFLATRIAYKLNLRGPCVTLHCACSTSLYAVDVACRQLLTGACSMAVAAGSGLTLPYKNGYVYEEGMIKSADGACRPFSDDANGTVEGNGMGAVVLKSLDDALRDRDRIYAVIRGTGANNDGARKVGYSAPSVEGQADVIRRALHMAEVDPATISYVEAHGTGTALGDPVEIEGLKKAFGSVAAKYCGIGSLKSNIGHLDTAAGISSLIKVVMALKHRQIPASINFRAPNPEIDFEHSPFYVVAETKVWENPRVAGAADQLLPLRAGVSSFGMGGTNVHLILEEAPELAPSTPGRAWKVLCLSAQDAAALARLEAALLDQVSNDVELDPSDLAYTLQVGRRNLPARAALVYRSMDELFCALGQGGKDVRRAVKVAAKARVAFLFAGQGTQYPGMGLGLYQSEMVFKEELERCLVICDGLGQPQVRGLLLNANPTAADRELLNRTDLSQPSLFAIEYATAKMFIDWGISPSAMIGHSLGEYVAACLAEVMSVEQALELVVARGRLMCGVPHGAMLAVAAAASDVSAWLADGVDIAAINAPLQCTVSGPSAQIEALAGLLEQKSIPCKRLHTSHAFHSDMMAPILESFKRIVAGLTLRPPRVAYISNVTGTWITPEQAQDPDYYVQHLRNTVRFADGAAQLLQDPGVLYLEVGPGSVLGTFLKQNAGEHAPVVISSLRHGNNHTDDAQYLARALGDLWTHGAAPDWKRYYRHETRSKVETPAYPFDKQVFPIGNADVYRLLENNGAPRQPVRAEPTMPGGATMVMGWQSTMLPCSDESFTVRPCLALIEYEPSLKSLAQVSGLRLTHVSLAKAFKAGPNGQFAADFNHVADLRRLVHALKAGDGVPDTLVYLADKLAGRSFKPLAERVQKLALALRSECPGQRFKCVLFIADARPEDRQEVLQSAEIDAYVRSMRATYAEFELRCVYLGMKLALDLRAEFMEREIYDADGSTVLAVYEHKRRQVYRPLAAPSPVALPHGFGNKTLGLLVPAGYPVAQLAERIGALSGARVVALSYEAPQGAKISPAIPISGAALRAYLRDNLQQDVRQYGLADLEPCHALMDEACTALVAAYVDASMPLLPGRRFERSELKAALRVTDRLEKYVDYFLAMLVEDRVLKVAGSGYEVNMGVAELRGLAEIKTQLEAQSGLFSGQIRLLEHCVAAYPGALSGDRSPIEVLYPEGKNELLRQTYANSVQEREDDVIRTIFEKLVRQIVDSAGQRPIRILEGGGGYGLMMRRIVPLLRGLDVEYYFTDIGKTFLFEAKEFALQEGYDFLTFGTFDITADPLAQGLEEKSFDLVFAFNVVHATRGLGATIGNLQRLLKDGGLMCLLERTKVRRYVDLIWGLADGWWHFDESERERSPLLDLEHWEAIARKAGFTDILAYPEDPDMRRQMDVGVLIAQTALPPSPVSTVSSNEPGPWLFSQLAPGRALDGLILLDERRDRDLEAFEPLGDTLSRARLRQDGYGNAMLEWLERHRPRFVSVWSSGFALTNTADQVERAHAAQELDRGGRALLGEGAWSRLYLPIAIDTPGARMPEDDVLRGALRVVQGRMDQVIIEPARQSLFHLAPGGFDASALASGKQESKIGAAADLVDANGYALLLHGLWSELFGIERIGADDDFFELGGDSLKVAQLTTELEKHGIKLLSNEVFSRPTIRSLADYLQENRQNEVGHVRSSTALVDHLREKLGLESVFKTVLHEDKPYQLLYLPDTVFEDAAGPQAMLRTLRLPSALEPHYVVPLSCLSATPAATAPQAIWRAMDLREQGGAVVNEYATQVQRGLSQLSNQVCGGAVVATYPLSPFQKMYLKGASRFSFYLIDFDEPLDINVLNRAFTDIVRLQGLMRSSLRRNFFGKPFWDEHAPPAKDLLVPMVDLSGYVPPVQAELLEKLMESEYQADFDSAEGIMYRLMLIRFDRRRHTLLFNLDHSIFDNMSGQVLRRQLLNRYRALAAGSNAPMESVKSFRDYLEQLNRGPQGINQRKIIDLFELERYREAKLKVEERIVARRQNSISKLRYELDMDQYQLSDDDEATWELTLLVLCCVLSRFLEQDAIPLKMVYQGRKYQDLSYFDTLGLFVDVLPLLVTVDRDDPAGMIEGIKRKVRFVNRYNISFMNMLLNLGMRFKWWDVLAPVGPKKLSNRDPMILLNYAGKAEREYQKVIEFAIRQMEKSGKKLDYASFYTIVTVVDRKIVFDVFCNFEKDMSSLRQHFEAEAARLLPQVAAPAQPDLKAAEAAMTPTTDDFCDGVESRGIV